MRPVPATRPWVLANMVCGIDGGTAVDGRVGILSGPTDRALFVDLRSVADVVLVGAETVRRESYGPPVLSPARRRAREAGGRRPVPRLGIVSRTLRLGDADRALEPGDGGERPLILTCTASPVEERRELADRAEMMIAGSGRVDWSLALAGLRERGVEIVLCEGGPSLLGELLAADMIDELCLTLAPWIGADPLSVANVPPGSGARRAKLAHVLEDDGSLFLRYLLEADDA